MTEDSGHSSSHSQDGVSHTLEITVPADTMTARLDVVTRAFRDQARMPGFRRGKAPLGMVRQQFGEEIRKRVLDDALPEHLGKELESRELEPIDTPELERLDFEPGGDLTFVVRFDTPPEVELRDTDLSATRLAVEVTDEMIQESLDDLRQRAARLVPADDDATAAEGMYARCDITLFPKDGKGRRLAEENRFVPVGEEKAIPGLNAQLDGMAVGEEREFVTQLADDYPNDLLAAKEVRCRVKVQELKKRHTPTLDDDFARDLDFESLDALRDRIRENLATEMEHQAERKVDDQLLAQLREKNPVQVPRSLIERRLDQMSRRFATDLAQQGVDPREALDWNAFRREQRSGAEASLAEEMLLDQVAEEAEIEVDEDTVTAEIRRQVEKSDGGQKRPVASVVQQMRKDGSFTAMRLSMRRRKALEHLRHHATIEPENGDSSGVEAASE